MAWAKSFGAAAFDVQSEDDIESVLAQAFAVTDRPVVVHVKSSAVQASAWR